MERLLEYQLVFSLVVLWALLLEHLLDVLLAHVLVFYLVQMMELQLARMLEHWWELLLEVL
jgi:hypothetical protein